MRRAKNLNKRDTFNDYFRRQRKGILNRAMKILARDLVREMVKKFPKGFQGSGGAVTGSVMGNSWQSLGFAASRCAGAMLLFSHEVQKHSDQPPTQP
jgi:hypothetical protein